MLEFSFTDTKNQGCDESEVEVMFDIFELTVGQIIKTPVSKAYFKLSDIPIGVEANVDEFSLTLERGKDITEWIGKFEAKQKTLTIFGKLKNRIHNAC